MKKQSPAHHVFEGDNNRYYVLYDILLHHLKLQSQNSEKKENYI